MMHLLQDLGLGMGSSGGVRQDGIIQDINRHAAVVMEGLPGSDGQTAGDVAEAVCLARQVRIVYTLTRALMSMT